MMAAADSEQSAQSIVLLYGYYAGGKRIDGHAACAISNRDGTFSMYNAIGIESHIKTSFGDYACWFQENYSPYYIIETIIAIG